MKSKEEKCPEHDRSFLPEDKGLWEVCHFGCDYPTGSCDCYCGEYCRKKYSKFIYIL